MPTRQKVFVLTLVFACSVILHSENKSLKILTIGNSFAGSARRYLPRVAASANCKVEIGRANMAGCSLERHWDSHLKSEKDPQYKPYPDKKTLIELLQEKKWDIVTMQQRSSKSFELKTYEPYFKNIYELVRKYAPQAEIVIQMTWSYRPEHKAFASDRYDVSDQNDMYEKLFKAYSDIAAKYKCRLLPVGTAIQLARQQQDPKFEIPKDFDPEKWVYPQKIPVPHTFISGYSWRKNKKGEMRMRKDLSHLNIRGCYLQACVWFAELFHQPTSNITFFPKKMKPEDAKFIRQIAQQAVDSSNKK